MIYRTIRPRSFNSVEQVDLLISPGCEYVPLHLNLHRSEFSDFTHTDDLGEYLGYET